MQFPRVTSSLEHYIPGLLYELAHFEMSKKITVGIFIKFILHILVPIIGG